MSSSIEHKQIKCSNVLCKIKTSLLFLGNEKIGNENKQRKIVNILRMNTNYYLYIMYLYYIQNFPLPTRVILW